MQTESITVEQVRTLYAEMLTPLREELAELRGENTSTEIINHENPAENETI